MLVQDLSKNCLEKSTAMKDIQMVGKQNFMPYFWAVSIWIK